MKNSLEFSRLSYCSVVKDLFVIRFLCIRSFIILSQFFLFVKNFLIYFVILSCFALQQLLYNIIFDLICQELFNFSFRSDLYCSDRSPSATFIDYHIWSLMSRSFFILFQKPDQLRCYIFLPFFQRRWLSYHSCIQYVNSFFSFLLKLILFRELPLPCGTVVPMEEGFWQS